MSRQSKIKYDPTKSIQQNADDNGVKVSAIRWYLAHHSKADRNKDTKKNIINAIRQYLQEHPDASKSEVSKNVENPNREGKLLSLSTVRLYWDYAKDKTKKLKGRQRKPKVAISADYYGTLDNVPKQAIFDYLDSSLSRKNLPVDPNRHTLWTESLKAIPDMLARADKEDVSALRQFFLEKPQMPMLFISSGSLKSFPAFLYSMNKGLGLVYTPLRFASLSDAIVKNSRMFLMSSRGKNDDIDYASKRCVKLNPTNTACYTSDAELEKNKLLKNLRGTTAKQFIYSSTSNGKPAFVGATGKFYKWGVYYRAFTGEDNLLSRLKVDLKPDNCFKIECNKDVEATVNLDNIEHFCILYGGFGEPVALDFEGVMTESGIASVQVSDYRNYCHGRFIFPSTYTQNSKEPRYRTNVAMILLVTPYERKLAKDVREYAIPSKTPIITVETDLRSPLASIDLLIKISVFVGYLGEGIRRINPSSPPNYCDIQKREPIYKIKFIDELNKRGNLGYTDNMDNMFLTQVDQPTVPNTVMDRINRMITEDEDNHTNQQQFRYFSYPTIDTLTKFEKYDTAYYRCLGYSGEEFTFGKEKGYFGNMKKAYPFELCGFLFYTAESAYICGMFSNNMPQHRDIQQELINESNGFKAKKYIRNKYEAMGLGREDWHDFNVQWMLFVVWAKVKGNKQFSDFLSAVPEDCTIIEDTTFFPKTKNDTSQFWGCRNTAQAEFQKLVKQHLKECPDDKELEKIKLNAIGYYEGCNVMGKILMLCKQHLKKNTEPEIDYELLRSKHIYLLGREITFGNKGQE